MPEIKILPETLSNKIAAGEVVERPASVVKELVENSLDAGSSRITVEVERGGRTLIRVSDNGFGMNRDNALLSLERYATSKIHRDQDLFSIRTLGFRGEALPSIASVSKFTLVTRDKASDSGTEIRVQGGKILKVSEAGAPPGTMISVEQLFFNTPARRKFLKSISTEMSHIADITASMAVGRPDVAFKLIHNKKNLKNWARSTDPINRVIDVLGRDLKKNLFPVNLDIRNLGLSGWIAAPSHSRSTNRGIFVFVNGRFVRDRMIQHALFAGYGQRLMKGRFPRVVLYIQVPFEHVDVNVHPTKNEVKFVHSRLVHDQIRHTVQGILAGLDRPKWPGLSLPGADNVVSEKTGMYVRTRPDEQAEPPAGRQARMDGNPFHVQGDINVRPRESIKPIHTQKIFKSQAFETTARARTEQTPMWSSTGFSGLKLIGQLERTYIICESKDSMILIDQHAAHERIVYEELKQVFSSRKQPSQKLLVPETIELGFREAQILGRLLEHLDQLGLELEPFGGNTYVIKAVPSILMGKEIPPIITDIVEAVADTGFSVNIDHALDESTKRMACHGAIRAGQELTQQQMVGLLKQMDACENASHCPHGRPTWIEWPMKAIEKLFRRII